MACRTEFTVWTAVAVTAACIGSLVLAGCGVTVGPGSSVLSVSPNVVTLAVGETAQFQVTSHADSCKWSSSNTNVFTTDGAGKISAVSIGDAWIDVSCNGNTAKASVHVVAASSPVTGNASPTYQWLAPLVGSSDSLGTLVLTSNQGSQVELLHPAIHGKSGTLRCKSATWDASGHQLTISYAMGSEVVHVTLSIAMQQVQLAVTMAADRPVISSVDAGAWAAGLQAQSITVPYYTGAVSYLSGINQYANVWWDWHTTAATSLSGTAAQYQTLTDGTLVQMQEKLVVALSPGVDDVFPFPGNPPSPYMAQLAGRMIVDISTAGFPLIQQGFEKLGDYGITGCAGIIHVWQHAGYDNALPEHLTANSSWGGNDALRAAIAAGKANHCFMAVHENYVDYYPNYPEFDPEAISLASSGGWINAWLNHLGIQSYATKPNWILKNAATQSPIIHQNLATTASYIDVNSAAPISTRGDMDARESEAGRLTSWMDKSASLWAYERQVHGGPVFGEGWSHWYYSGLLDGVEAQMGAGVPWNSGEDIPLFVDFDLLRMHPLQVNQGMGNYARWVKSGLTIITAAQLDAYRMQEIAFGHAPFLDTTYWDDVIHGFIESNLISPVASLYGTAQASSIQYRVGDAWVSSSVAARVGQFSTVQIGYGNHLVVVANASPSSFTWKGTTLPQYGWIAKSNSLLAYTAMCGQMICDYAETPTSVFANARNQTDIRMAMLLVQPNVTNMKPDSNRSFSITYNWKIYQPLSSTYKVFVHFVDDNELDTNEGIVFQADHMSAMSTAQWTPGSTVTDGPWMVTLPSTMSDGIYSIRMGLFDTQTGGRMRLGADVDDGSERYIVGYLTVKNGGTQISFTPPPVQADDPRLNISGSVLNFGTVQTDGAISMRQENGQWVLRPFPRYRSFTVLLDGAHFPVPSVIQAIGGGKDASILPIMDGQYWQLPLNGADSYSWPISQN